MIVCVGFAFVTCCFELTAWRPDLLCIAFASCFRLVVLGACNCCSGFVVFSRLCDGFSCRLTVWSGLVVLFGFASGF